MVINHSINTKPLKFLCLELGVDISNEDIYTVIISSLKDEDLYLLNLSLSIHEMFENTISCLMVDYGQILDFVIEELNNEFKKLAKKLFKIFKGLGLYLEGKMQFEYCCLLTPDTLVVHNPSIADI